MAEFILCPEGLATFPNAQTLEVGKTCVGRVVRYDKELGCLFVYLGGGKIGIIPEMEATIYEYTYPYGDTTLTPYQISSIVGKKITAKIMGISSGIYILSRRKTIKEAYKQITSKANKNVRVQITAIYDYGLFCDIGNGVIGFVPISYCSLCRIQNLKKYFSVGDTIKVKITEIKTPKENYRITLSRKDAFKTLEFDTLATKSGDVCIGTICLPVQDCDGYYVEVTPAISGIVDVPHEVPHIHEGTKASFYVRKVTEKGLKLGLVALLT